MSIHELRPREKVLELAVVRFVDGWRILAGAHRWGRFNDSADAGEAALRVSAPAREAGRHVRILVQGFAGELRPLDIA